MAKATFEFDYFDERNEIETIMRANSLYCALSEIDTLCRSREKHGDHVSDLEQDLIDRIRECVTDSGMRELE